jgi:hypothetical protein
MFLSPISFSEALPRITTAEVGALCPAEVENVYKGTRSTVFPRRTLDCFVVVVLAMNAFPVRLYIYHRSLDVHLISSERHPRLLLGSER